MQNYKLNETPVRTAKNFGINDIELDIEIPIIKDFDNFCLMSSNTDNIKITDLLNGNARKKISSKIGLELESNYGMTITIPKNTKIELPIILNFNFDDDNITLVDNIKIIYEENSKAYFILKFDNDDNGKYFHNLKQETIANKNSKGSITILNFINNNSNSFIAVENTMKENADIQYNFIELGGKNKISNYYAKLEGDGSKNIVKNIYVGTKEELIDINYNIDVIGKDTYCNIETKGAISGNTKKNFKGTIDFKEGAKKAVGIENENCMLLSDTANSKSLPMLLCHEEDVSGEHGVSTGKLDEDKIFYIMTKGISYNDARKLIVMANFNSIINNLKDENIKDEIIEKINNLL